MTRFRVNGFCSSMVCCEVEPIFLNSGDFFGSSFGLTVKVLFDLLMKLAFSPLSLNSLSVTIADFVFLLGRFLKNDSNLVLPVGSGFGFFSKNLLNLQS